MLPFLVVNISDIDNDNQNEKKKERISKIRHIIVIIKVNVGASILSNTCRSIFKKELEEFLFIIHKILLKISCMHNSIRSAPFKLNYSKTQWQSNKTHRKKTKILTTVKTILKRAYKSFVLRAAMFCSAPS